MTTGTSALRSARSGLASLKQAGLILLLAASAGVTAELPPPFPPDPQQHLERTCFQTGGAVERHRQPALRRGHRVRHRPRPAAAHPDLARPRLPHPRHDRRLLGQLPGLPLRPVRRRQPRGRGADGARRATRSATAATSITCARARTSASSSAWACSARWTPGPRRSTWRSRSSGCAAATRKASSASGRAYYGEEWQPPHSSVDAQWRASKLKYLPLPARAAAGVRLRAGLQPPHGPARALLRAHPQPAQLRPLAHRQPGVEPGPAEGLRRLHRAGLDRHRAHAQPLSRPTARAHLRDRLPRIRRDAEPRPRHRPHRSGS